MWVLRVLRVHHIYMSKQGRVFGCDIVSSSGNQHGAGSDMKTDGDFQSEETWRRHKIEWKDNQAVPWYWIFVISGYIYLANLS